MILITPHKILHLQHTAAGVFGLTNSHGAIFDESECPRVCQLPGRLSVHRGWLCGGGPVYRPLYDYGGRAGRDAALAQRIVPLTLPDDQPADRAIFPPIISPKDIYKSSDGIFSC